MKQAAENETHPETFHGYGPEQGYDFLREELRKYFPSGYTEEQMRRDIIKGLELLKRQRERNRDAR